MLASIFLTFFQIGLFTFGGGYAMIANIREVIVERKAWLDEEELLRVITIAESTPGPIAINLATYVGYKRRGVLGSLFATLGVVLPSMIIIFVISLFLDAFMQNRYVAYAFVGIRCAVAYLIIKAGVDMLRKLPRKPFEGVTFCVVAVLLLVLELLSVHFSSIVLILIGGVLGMVVYGVARHKEVGSP